jgi:hypothetical protein
MTERHRLTDNLLKRLRLEMGFPPYAKRRFVYDTLVPRLAWMVTEGGSESFVFVYRHAGRSWRQTFQTAHSVAEARRLAAEAAAKLAADQDPMRHTTGAPTSLRAVVMGFLRARGPGYRSRGEFLARMERYVFPTLGARPIEALTRSVTLPLVDAIALDKDLPHAAHAVARDLNTVGRWYAKRTDSYSWPAIPSPLTEEHRRARDRVLSDAELRAVWKAAESPWHPGAVPGLHVPAADGGGPPSPERGGGRGGAPAK